MDRHLAAGRCVSDAGRGTCRSSVPKTGTSVSEEVCLAQLPVHQLASSPGQQQNLRRCPTGPCQSPAHLQKVVNDSGSAKKSYQTAAARKLYDSLSLRRRKAHEPATAATAAQGNSSNSNKDKWHAHCTLQSSTSRNSMQTDFASSPSFVRRSPSSSSCSGSGLSVLSPSASSSTSFSSRGSISMLCSDSYSSFGDRQGSDSAAGCATESAGCVQESVTANQDALELLHQAPPYNLSELDDDLLALSLAVQDIKNNGNSFLYEASPFDLSQLDDDLLASRDSKADKDACQWLHRAPPYDLEEMNDELLDSII